MLTKDSKNISHQFKIARGHLSKVMDMYENGEYCIDVVHQSLAVQSALKKINQQILKFHLENCVANAIKKGNGKKVIGEIMEIIKKQ